MPTAQAHIPTGQPGRYLIQLCRHANSINHRTLHHAGRAQLRPDIQQAEWSDTHATLTWPGAGPPYKPTRAR